MRYTPATGTWRSAGTLKVPRFGHRAVRLQNGQVLMAGGSTSPDPAAPVPTATVELYNPATNTWSLAASMSTPRNNLQLTLLANGRVLASGGQRGGPQALATAEVYDPVANAWSPVGSMRSARYLAGAALLSDGRVLVAGGSDGNGPHSSAEIFNPSTGTWSAASSMAVPRYAGGMAVLPGGRVLVAGGSDALPGAEIFDPISGAWSPTGAMAQPFRYFFETIPLADGRVLIAGGTGTAGDSVEIYDHSIGGLWLSLATMSAPRFLAVSAELLDGRILIAGGFGTNTAETFRPCPPNLAPVAVCRNVQVRTSDTPNNVCSVTANVDNGSYDPDNGPGPLTVSQSPAGPFGPGSSSVTLTANDGFLTSSCPAVVTLVDNTPPQLTCRDDDPTVPGNQAYLECVNGGAVGTFTAQATDNCGGASATCTPSGVRLPLGSTPVTCTARDGSQNQASCNLQAIVRDTQAPIPAGSRDIVLWPANSAYHDVTLMDCAGHLDDVCNGKMVPLKDHAYITHVTSDEPAGAAPDIQFHVRHDWQVRLRATRNSSGNGRVYTIHYRAKDPAGNCTPAANTATCKVFVPFTQGSTPIDNGAQYSIPTPHAPRCN